MLERAVQRALQLTEGAQVLFQLQLDKLLCCHPAVLAGEV